MQQGVYDFLHDNPAVESGPAPRAASSTSCKSIIATRSTAAKGKVSRIVPRLDGPVTTPRIDTHYVETEYGAVNLKRRSSSERATALIGLAHPQFRDARAAKALHLFQLKALKVMRVKVSFTPARVWVSVGQLPRWHWSRTVSARLDHKHQVDPTEQLAPRGRRGGCGAG